ncbi:1-deoxy-D-xylulose 5-phosphate reductoisomerase [Chlamydia ibidis]|uniref:1-deoxy-D-xylulose 5-phosphate reductoisomerase n=2 Tax=Chlamydia ibidis TaxID=1405396 RepID=S7KML7_9CHLA|nr:1-deoxy-D-xylulose-5-phosphate reductoisomerase [Chlamydia ibidis]EPP35685.1 1-deoxy-D-xylulose 5-phosphate reductoisomerase [Chlamydia ibidis]EQM62779.1 1-deoxy-D-xylulose 5-phosphate reductoisomerase [Chlamydia ibidis 10-1398/6]
MKRLAILGSTGSVGRQALQIVRNLPDSFSVVSLAAHGNNSQLLCEQILEFSPRYVSVFSQDVYQKLRDLFPNIEVALGDDGLIGATTHEDVDTIIAASSGVVALPAIIEGIRSRKNLALANKEVLVSAGEIIQDMTRTYGVKILPIDSEHNALYQCLEGRRREDIKKLILTASGGPLLNKSKEELNFVTIQEVLQHPTWNMGTKITVDSSTLVNKGLEIIEAYWLFGLENVEIDAIMHPQSLVHGMVEFQDGTIISAMNPPSMLFPIQYALTAPYRYSAPAEGMSFHTKQVLEFFPIDTELFPSILLAKEVLKSKGSAGSFFNAANETLVARFLKEEITWRGILDKLVQLMGNHRVHPCNSLDDIFAVDKEARALAQEI